MYSRRLILRHSFVSFSFVLLYLLLNRPEVIFFSRIGFVAWYPAIGLVMALLLGIYWVADPHLDPEPFDHELGHFQCLDWKARCLLWASAIESIFTTNSREHQGTTVATERIKWFLGDATSIYAPGDLTEFVADPEITIGDIVNALYNDRILDVYFLQTAREGPNGGVGAMEVLVEAASFIIRSSLLKILRNGLTNHFIDASAAESYFDANNLTNSQIRGRAAQP
jgi:hypothetical protein